MHRYGTALALISRVNQVRTVESAFFTLLKSPVPALVSPGSESITEELEGG